MSIAREFDVIIIGAGLSGIGAAYNLIKNRPGTTFAILEGRERLGGTWDLFRYPGIRSDSDLFTFGYEFKPWEGDEAIADGAAIKNYIAGVSKENGIDEHILYNRPVSEAHWDSAVGRWTLTVTHNGKTEKYTAKWIFCASGYYRYDEGFTPAFEGREKFKGDIIHPQHWPEDYDYTGKRAVVIGSGATAVTLIPSMADKTEHITMLQRTPTYVMSIPQEDGLGRLFRKWFGRDRAAKMLRGRNIFMQRLIFKFCLKYPGLARAAIRSFAVKQLPQGFPVDVHFNPPYSPWDQRLCAVPDGDLFKVLSNGSASIVTDKIQSFTETGIQLQSGKHLDADLIITATGLNLLPMGGVKLFVDNVPVKLAETVTFKGMLLSGVPNFALSIGYTSSSWTLKVGLLCEHFCRLLKYMSIEGYDVCTPEAEPAMKTKPFLNFGAGYVQRSITELPLQGDGYPWSMSWNYVDDVKVLRKGAVTDPNLKFTRVSKTRTKAKATAEVG